MKTLLILPLLLASTSFAGEAPPNIVILLADDLGYGELGCQGNPQIPTPHIDSIAARGVRFTQGYVTASYCSASRAGFMTGRYQARFGYDFNPIGAKNELPGAGLPPGETTIARRLHDRGYATALIGKWHLGGTAAYHPVRRGFDEFFGFTHEGHYFVPPPYRGVTTMLRRRSLPGGQQGRWTSADGRLILSTHMGYDEPAYDANNPLVRQSQPVDEQGYLTDAFTREAIDFIGRHKSRPFFLLLAYNAVHSPLQAADEYLQRFTGIEDMHRRIFAAMLANLDDSVGRVLNKLQAEGLLDNTLIFFFSDNGGPTRELTSSNLPLRGGKGDVYEGGLRVPMMCQWPEQIPAGFVFDQPVISLDIAATAAAVANLAAAVDNGDGVNLIPFLTADDQEPPHHELFWRMGQRAALRQGAWKVVRNSRSQAGKWELFHLGQDHREAVDRAQDQPETLAKLIRRWHELNGQMAAPIRW